ncbi:MAG: hypothetical protein HUU35_16335 [Armatimonadetes bacterium]|nr:hypothetical protein [Armatimonadota bacterium]
MRFRLEKSYRVWGLLFFLLGGAGFAVSVLSGHLLLLFLTGPACGAGLWLYFNDPREYLVVNPRRHRLQLVRSYGKKNRVRREYQLKEFVRLETARYLNRPKGLRCMILLWRADGSVEKVDDRLDDPELTDLCAEVAAAAGIEYVDKGRVDSAPSKRLGDEPELTLDA